MDERVLYRHFGERLREVRTEQGVRQADLADAVGLSRTSITNIERGNQAVALATLYELARALRVDVTELLPDDDGPRFHADLTDLPDEWQQWVQRTRERVS